MACGRAGFEVEARLCCPGVGAIKSLDCVLPSAHGMRVMTQRHDRVLVSGELGDEADRDALRLKR